MSERREDVCEALGCDPGNHADGCKRAASLMDTQERELSAAAGRETVLHQMIDDLTERRDTARRDADSVINAMSATLYETRFNHAGECSVCAKALDTDASPKAYHANALDTARREAARACGPFMCHSDQCHTEQVYSEGKSDCICGLADISARFGLTTEGGEK